MDCPPGFDFLFNGPFGTKSKRDPVAYCLDCKWKGKLSEAKTLNKEQVCPVCSGMIKWSER